MLIVDGKNVILYKSLMGFDLWLLHVSALRKYILQWRHLMGETCKLSDIYWIVLDHKHCMTQDTYTNIGCDGGELKQY